jgi:hypothetical protein
MHDHHSASPFLKLSEVATRLDISVPQQPDVEEVVAIADLKSGLFVRVRPARKAHKLSAAMYTVAGSRDVVLGSRAGAWFHTASKLKGFRAVTGGRLDLGWPV